VEWLRKLLLHGLQGACMAEIECVIDLPVEIWNEATLRDAYVCCLTVRLDDNGLAICQDDRFVHRRQAEATKDFAGV